MMNQNIPKPTQDIDPRYLQHESFRKTLAKIKHQKHLAAHALSETPSSPTREEFADFSRKFAGETQDRDEKMHASILATLPGALKAHHTLSAERESLEGISRREHHAAISKTIAFNNTLRSAIEANPRIEGSTLLFAIKTAAHYYQYSPDDFMGFEQEVNMTLRGMQHELAFESILWNLPEGFEVLETSDEDDAHGIDYQVKCPNNRIVSIDVKASQASADRQIEKRTRLLATRGKSIPANELILYSGFKRSDFNPNLPWRPTYDATAALTPIVEQKLRTASGEVLPHAKDISLVN